MTKSKAVESTNMAVEVNPAPQPIAAKSSTDVLAEIMLRRELKDEQERQNKEVRNTVADARRKKEDAGKLENDRRRQTNCDHLQGNHRLGESPFREISHLSLHTFGGPSTTDNRRIRCNKCGFRWYPGDLAETIVRDGQKIDNPTTISWKEAYKIIMKNKNVGNKPSTGFIDVFVAAPAYKE